MLGATLAILGGVVELASGTVCKAYTVTLCDLAVDFLHGKCEFYFCHSFVRFWAHKQTATCRCEMSDRFTVGPLITFAVGLHGSTIQQRSGLTTQWSDFCQRSGLL